MPIYDYECPKCGVFESIEPLNKPLLWCPNGCELIAKRIISVSGVHTANDDAAWVRSCLEVVDKESQAPHVAEFRKNPTRTNLRRYMSGEGLRHLEPGEEGRRPQAPDLSKVRKEVLNNLQRRWYITSWSGA